MRIKMLLYYQQNINQLYFNWNHLYVCSRIVLRVGLFFAAERLSDYWRNLRYAIVWRWNYTKSMWTESLNVEHIHILEQIVDSVLVLLKIHRFWDVKINYNEHQSKNAFKFYCTKKEAENLHLDNRMMTNCFFGS